MAKLSRRHFLGLTAAGMAGSMLAPRLAAFAQTAAPTAPATPTAGPLPPAPVPGPIDLKTAGGMDALVAAAQKEGALTVITLPPDWADYGEIMKNFQAKYNITITDLNPDGGSGDEIAAIKATAGSSGPQAPDVIDVGFKWGEVAKSGGLVQPYKVATWDTIPDAVKDKDGYYFGDYTGTMSFAVNTDVVKNVPKDWSDLLKPEYKGLIAIGGDPLKASEADHAIWASALANGGSLDNPQPGLDFFAQLAKAGNLAGAVASSATLGKGDTPICVVWDFNALSWRDANKSNANVQVLYPASGTIATVYLQGISAYSPRPNAARLWQEYLYSDEGQLLFLKGYAKPVRFDDLMKNNKVSADLLAALPKSNATVSVPSLAQINAALTTIANGWQTQIAPLLK